MSLIEFVFDEPIDDGAFADVLVSDEDNLEFVDVLLAGGVGQLVFSSLHSCFVINIPNIRL